MQVTKIIRTAYADVVTFNAVAGNLTNVTDDSIDNQLDFIFEEFQETVTAFEEGNKVELLDGAADLFVTVAGLLQKLEAAGYDVATALERVNANNLSKFPQIGTLFGNKNGYEIVPNVTYNRIVLKDENGKVRKPDNFVAVDLSDLVPKE